MRKLLRYIVREVVKCEGGCVIREECFELFIVIRMPKKIGERDEGRDVIAFSKYVRSCLEA